MSETQEIVKEYTNDADSVTVVWKPGKCIHTGICLRGLPKVFNLKQKPWVHVNDAPAEAIIDLVHRCPSGALTIKGEPEHTPTLPHTVNNIQLIRKGPIIIEGDADVHEENGETTQHQKAVAFCRCGLTKKHPYCDGSHVEQFKRNH